MRIVRIDSVVIDRRTNRFGGTRFNGVKNKYAVISRQTNHCPTRIVRNAHNVKIAATVLKILLDRRTQTAVRPDASESPPELSKAAELNGNIQGTTKRTADKGGCGMWVDVDDIARTLDGASECNANSGCEFVPAQCYCAPEVVCICGGGRPPQYRVKR